MTLLHTFITFGLLVTYCINANTFLSFEEVNEIEYLKNAFQYVAGNWTEITSSLDPLPPCTYESLTIKETLKGIRFANIQVFQRNNKLELLNDTIESYIKKVHAPEENIPEIQSIINQVNINDGDFINIDMIYNDKRYSVKYSSVFIVIHKSKGVFDIMHIEINRAQESKENISVIRYAKSNILGMINITEENTNVNKTADYKVEEINYLFKIFRMITMSALAEFFGFILPLPELKVN